MSKRWEVLLAVITWIGIFHLELLRAERVVIPLKIAWMLKPPYTLSPANGSLFEGMIRDVIFSKIENCMARIAPSSKRSTEVKLLAQKTSSEFEMIELLRQNNAQIAVPVFDSEINRRYSNFNFFKLHDYPGSEFIILQDETDTLDIVLDEVLKSWPLLVITLVLTAIAGVIMWVLDTYWNSEEFPRSFIKGSWDGFWWSFISMTTVGYGDKTPKSIFARIFAIFWILFGAIVMAIFTANVTSALTTHSLDMAQTKIAGLKVAVLSNRTEYQHALYEDAYPKVYNTIEDIVEAVKSKQVDGMLLDHYTASYYHKRNKLTSLITAKKLEFRRDVGILISKDKMAKCLAKWHRSSISSFTETITNTFKKPTKNVSLFDGSAPFVKKFLYVSLGVLGGLLLIGTVCDIGIKGKAKNKDDVELVYMGELNNGFSIERDAVRSDLELTRKLLREVQEHVDKLETTVFQICEKLEAKTFVNKQ